LIFKEKMSAHMLTCEEITRLKSESMDFHLPLRKRLAVWFHLLFCRWCRRYGKQLDMIRRASRKIRAKIDNLDDKPDLTLSSDARERLRKILNG